MARSAGAGAGAGAADMVSQPACETTTEEKRAKSAANTVSLNHETQTEKRREIDERSKAEMDDATMRKMERNNRQTPGNKKDSANAEQTTRKKQTPSNQTTNKEKHTHKNRAPDIPVLQHNLTPKLQQLECTVVEVLE